ncbi:MAG TPA: Clp protease N-terminal domain-containing protein, partial [Polyangia bacterium]|nr:Clp protease N-terminal domain-containing protein [Polyangia bacterium]
MRTDKLTTKAQEALQQAQALAERRGHQELTPEHLLAALLAQEQGVVPALLRKIGVDLPTVQANVE